MCVKLLYLFHILLLFDYGFCYIPVEWASLKSLEPSKSSWFRDTRRYRRDSPSVPTPKEANEGTNKTCCMGATCYSPCPVPVVPMYPLPAQFPVVLPARTVYEPVIHNHPPIHKIPKLLKADKRNRLSSSDETYTDTSSSESDYDSD